MRLRYQLVLALIGFFSIAVPKGILAQSAADNPLYSPGLTPVEMLGEAMGEQPIGQSGPRISYWDLANAASGNQPVVATTANGSTITASGTRWEDLGLFSHLPPDVEKYYEASGLRASLYVIDGKHILAFGSSEPVSVPNLISNRSQMVKDWVSTDLLRDYGYNSAIGTKFWNFALGTDKNWKDYQADQSVAALYIASKLHQTYPDLQVTGFSLGGNHADYVGALLKIPAVAFEPTAVHFAAGQRPSPNSILNFDIQGNIANYTGKLFGNTIRFGPALAGSSESQFKNNAVLDSAKDPIALHSMSEFKTIYNGLKAVSNTGAVVATKSGPSGVELTVSKNANVASRMPDPWPSSPVKPNSPSGAVVPPVTSAAPAARVSPGGISLNQAAAERLPLNLTLDGAYITKGRIILSGPNNTRGGIDAALFLTALRAACENSDPYFSLDADDIASWLAETTEAAKEFSEATKGEFNWRIQKGVRRTSPSILSFKTISASQAYPKLWQSILARHANMRSRLVFRPEWLRQTRFGEILYIADVLLKELAGGANSLGESLFRAANINGYRSATERVAATALLYQFNGWRQTQESPGGGRVWYDLTESSDTVVGAAEAIPRGDSELRRMLESRGLLTTLVEQSKSQSLIENGGAIDLSDVYPRMFVRAFDPVTHRDSSARFPGLNELVAQANKTPQQYATAYKEYEALVEVFRAYVVAVRARQVQPGLCQQLPRELLASEKSTTVLPEYHLTDFTLTIGWYEYTDGQIRRAISGPGGLFQGGVAIGATKFLQSFVSSSLPTPLITKLKEESAKPIDNYLWKASDNRTYVALIYDGAAAQSQSAALQPPNQEQSVRPDAQAKIDPQPAISGSIGRFDLYEGARIEGPRIASVTLRNDYARSAPLAEHECAAVCSGDSDCIGFDIDQKQNICTTYSSVWGTHLESQWTHGIWK